MYIHLFSHSMVSPPHRMYSKKGYTATTHMKEGLTTKHWHKLFEVTLFMKGFNGVWETISGLTFLLLSKATLSHWYIKLARNELIEDPTDRVGNFVVHILLNPNTGTKTFTALYILISYPRNTQPLSCHSTSSRPTLGIPHSRCRDVYSCAPSIPQFLSQH